MMCFNLAFAQALPVSKMQSALSGVLQSKVASRGFAANDPRFGATLTKISGGLGSVAGTAAMITVGAVTAPGWASVALAAGVGTVVTYAVTLGVEGLIKWWFGNTDIDVSANGAGAVPGLNAGQGFWSAGGRRGTIYGGDGIAIAREAYAQWAQEYGITASPTCTLNASQASCVASQPDGAGSYLTKQALYYDQGAPITCGAGQYSIDGGLCVGYTSTGNDSINDATPNQAVQALPATESNKALNPEVLAGVANAAWRNASSQPGYDGVPYSPADPITPADVSAWKNANPTRYPTVGDFVAPQVAANQPWSLPANPTATTQQPGQTTSPSTNPSTEPVANLGPDPAIGTPGLEEPPTPQQILEPILKILPGFDNWSVPAHATECPKPAFDLYDQHFVMDAQCTIAENNRAVILALMTAVWSMWAVFIVLRA
jgi:hypothetical protein